jgi:hypothetical protein
MNHMCDMNHICDMNHMCDTDVCHEYLLCASQA